MEELGELCGAILLFTIAVVLVLALDTFAVYLAVEVVGEFYDLDFNEAVGGGILLLFTQLGGASAR